jgi:hypothetical protein
LTTISPRAAGRTTVQRKVARGKLVSDVLISALLTAVVDFMGTRGGLSGKE